MKTRFATRALSGVLPFGGLAMLATLIACDGDDAITPPTKLDAGVPSIPDASPVDAGATDSGGDTSTDAARPPAMFLPSADYATLVSLDPAFPFGVTQVHKVKTVVEPVVWGAHGGPVVTDPTGALPKVTRFTVPADPRADATLLTNVVLPSPSGLPTPAFFSYLGVADVSPSRTLFSYTAPGAIAPGELLLLDNALAVKARANANGIFDQKAWTRGADTFIAYTAFSGLSAAATTTNDNGLYLAQLCADALLPTGTCKASFPLLKWAGFSGPVVTDLAGNVFVAASVLSKPDAIYALSNSEVAGAVAAGTTLTKTALAEGAMGGSSAFAAIAPEGAGEGWILYRGGDFMAPDVSTKAIPYLASGAGVQKTARAEIPEAIVKGAMATDLYYFTDNDGDFWIAVSTPTGGAFLELRRK
jgi:hypothetical protein